MPGERRSRLARVVVALAVLGAAALGSRSLLAQPVQASPDHENGFVTAINEVRGNEGLTPLSVDDGLVDAAREWTKEMVGDGELAHAADITEGVPPGWTKAGENVGRGEHVAGLMAAFIDSTGHRRNLLDPEFNRIGVGSIVNQEGVLYTTHRFAHAPDTAPAGAISHDVSVECSDGRPRLVTRVSNAGLSAANVGAWLGHHAEQTAKIDAGSSETFSADNQPPGDARLRLFIDDLLIADEVVDIGC